MISAYVPSKLNAIDYPGLVARDAPVDTVAIATGLFVGPVVAGSDQSRKLANVVDTFFTQFQTLLAPGYHGKWAEVNLSSQIPGWQRFVPADEWLKRNASVAAGQDLRMIFMRFLDERAKTGGGQQMSQEQKDALFDQFRHWQTGQSNPDGLWPLPMLRRAGPGGGAVGWCRGAPRRLDFNRVHGGILEFAVDAEPPNYDCHAEFLLCVHSLGHSTLFDAAETFVRRLPKS